MSDTKLDAVKRFWENKATAASTDCEKVDSSQRTQRMRFERFLIANQLNGASVLDVGCGVGDFLAHLHARDISCDYSGVDISSGMIDRCRERHPDADFRVANILGWDPAPRYDYVVAIAIHNVKTEAGWELLEQFTQQQFALCRVAAHLSLLTDQFDGFAEHIQPWSPHALLTLALSISPYVSIQHDYLPHDFSVTLYREPLIDTRKGLVLGA